MVNNGPLQNQIIDANVSAYNDKSVQKKWMNKSNSVSAQPSFLPSNEN
jgi:hypothetical protein